MSKSAPIRILIVEDFHGETDLLLIELSEADLLHESLIVKDEKEYKKALSSFSPDIILSPYSLMTTNAIKLLGIARKANVDAPFILLAFDLSEDIAIDLLGDGIEDYVQHSTLKRLPVAIKKALQRHKTQRELQESQVKLKTSEASMRNMVRNAPIAVAMFDSNMNYLVVSDFWLKHEEKTESIIGKNHYDVVPEIRESWKSVHQKVLAGETHGSEHEKMDRADGSLEILRWKMNPWYTSEGAVGGAVLFIEDITETVEARKNIAKNQQLVTIGEELGSSGSFEFDLTSQQPRWSENMYRIKGFEPNADISHEEYIKHVHPEDLNLYIEGCSVIMQSVAPTLFEYRLIRPDNGNVVHLRVHSAFVKNKLGEPISLMGSVQDVTHIRLSEIALLESESSLKLAQNIAKIGSWSLNLSNNQLDWSDEMFQIHGIEKQPVPVELVRGLTHPGDLELFDKSFDELVSGSETDMVYRIIHPLSKEVRHFSAKGRVTKNSDGSISEISGTVQDITEQHTAAVELEQSAASLKRAQQVAKVGSWEWNKGEECVELSNEMYSIYETNKKCLTVKDIRNFIHPDDKKRVEKEVENDLNDKIIPVVNYRIISAKKNVKHVISSAKQVFDSEGNVIQLVGTLQDVTDRAEIEAALHEQENLFQEMAENIGEVFWLTNRTGEEIIYMSPLYEKVYGGSLKELFKDGNAWSNNIHHEDKSRVADSFRKNGELGLYDEKYRLTHPDGTVKWVHARAFPIKDENGEVVRLAGITQDITEQTLTQKKLSEKRLQQSLAINASKIGIWHWNIGEDNITWDNRCYEIFGVESGGLSVEQFFGLLHSEDQELVRNKVEEAINKGDYKAEYRMVLDGKTTHILAHGKTTYNEEGKPKRMDGVILDVTEKTELQLALQENEGILREMAENITEVFWLTDWINNQVLYVSPQYESLYSLSMQSLYNDGASWEAAVHPDDLDRIATLFRETAHLGTYDQEFRLVVDGEVKWVRDRAFPIKDEKGTVVRMAGITEEVTHQKKVAEKVETLSLVASETVNGVLIQDPTGKILWSNKGFSKISGYNLDDIVGKKPWSFLSGEETNTRLTEIAFDKIKKGKSFTSENVIYTENKVPVWISLAVSPILNSAGELSTIVSVGTDISKQKELEDLQRSMLSRMETRVAERTSELEGKNQELRKEIWENQRISDELYHSNLDLKDSIQYAKRIQESILPAEKLIQKSFPHGFVLFLPRDVVSGDFYWYYKRKDLTYFAAIDCTGHGVPGALMSMIANELMNQAVIQKNLTDPGEIISHLNKLMVRTLRQKQENHMRDGMDLSVIVVDHSKDELHFGGAFANLYLAQNGLLTVYNGNRHSVGGHLEDVEKHFETTSIKIKSGDTIYLSTDGYIDQFGGPDGKKLMKKRFVALLEEVIKLPLDEQKIALEKKFTDWKGPLNQVDDVLLAGLRY